MKRRKVDLEEGELLPEGWIDARRKAKAASKKAAEQSKAAEEKEKRRLALEESGELPVWGLLPTGTIKTAPLLRRYRRFACGHKITDSSTQTCVFCAAFPKWSGRDPWRVNTEIKPHPTESGSYTCSIGHWWFGVNRVDNKLCLCCAWASERPIQPLPMMPMWDDAVERATLTRKELAEKYGKNKPLDWRCSRRACSWIYTCTFAEFGKCPHCKNKRSSLELAFIDVVGWEIDGWMVTEQEQHKLPWCKFYTDFTLRKNDKVLIVEIDGPQHFGSVLFGTCDSDKDREREQYHLKHGECVLRIAYNYPISLWKRTLLATLRQVEKNKLGPSIICASMDVEAVYDKPMADLREAVPGLTTHSHTFQVEVPHDKYCKCMSCTGDESHL